MLYRKFGKEDLQTSVLGFGCMRLPQTNPADPTAIDEQEAIRMIRHAIDAGVNYVDTAYPYHGGKSEVIVGKALKDGYREKVLLATKLPSWLIKSPEDFDTYLNEQLKKLDTDHIDVYLVHAINKERWENLTQNGVLKFLDRAIQDGRIRYAGFSYHEDIKFFRTVVDAYPFSMCQVQYNYMEDEAWRDEIAYASQKGAAVVIMEPLLGGKLAKGLNDASKQVLAAINPSATPAEWALRWIWNHPEVSVVLSGMSNFAQVEENLALCDKAKIDGMSQQELDAIRQVKKIYEESMLVKCTQCNYCQPCPQDVAIPDIFDVYNKAYLYNSMNESRFAYAQFIKGNNADAARCVECGQCESACPQKLPIVQHLKEAHQALE